MELEKKKYKRNEVCEILDAYKIDYENKLKEQTARIVELTAENKKLSAEVSDFKNKEELIFVTLRSAEEKAEEIRKNAELKYALQVESLRNFSRKWKNYFDYLSEKYPHYQAIKEAMSIYSKLGELLENGADSVIETIDGLIPDKNKDKVVFDPKSKISEYIAATGDNGFNLDEVLNPGKLELEDLCKELGLIDEL